MNSTIEKQLSHRTIRAFKDQALPQEWVDTLIHVAQRTATSTGLQASSIIRLTDPKQKQELAQICGQSYVAQASELWVFLVDHARNDSVAKLKGLEKTNAGDFARFIQGFTDASLMAQNVVNAAESLDLGTVYLGSIHNDIPKLIELLKLPRYTFPVLGLGMGFPNQSPELKPRMDMNFRIFENHYPNVFPSLDAWKDYDAAMNTYYDLRNANQRLDTFTDQVKKRYSAPTERDHWIELIENQGFKD